jgi:hypothetical protein
MIFCANILYVLKVQVFNLVSCFCFSFTDSVDHKKNLTHSAGFPFIKYAAKILKDV